MEAKKKDNTTYEFVCKAQTYDYIQLLDLIKKYDMGERDMKIIVEVVYNYLDNNWRW